MFTTGVRPLFCRFHCEGRDLVPAAGGVVLTCNHVMGPDFIVLGYASPRQVYYMAKQELFDKSRALAGFLDYFGVFPIRRGETDLAAVEHAISLVKNGKVLGMFPEGTRSRSGKLQRGRSGAAHIAMQTQAPVVPVVVINAEHIFKTYNWLSFKPRAKVLVRFGKPLDPPAAEDRRALRSFTREIMQAMAALMPPELSGSDRAMSSDEEDVAGVEE